MKHRETRQHKTSHGEWTMPQGTFVVTPDDTSPLKWPFVQTPHLEKLTLKKYSHKHRQLNIQKDPCMLETLEVTQMSTSQTQQTRGTELVGLALP